MNIVEQHYTVQETAEIAKIDPEQVLSWIHSGELAAVNVAKSLQCKRPSWRIPESALGKLLIGRRHPASTQPTATHTAKRRAPKQIVSVL